MKRVRSLAMVVLLALPSSGCAQLKNLRNENATLREANAKLQAERDCCGDEKERLTKELEEEKAAAITAETKAADALAQAEGQRQRATVLEQELTHTREQVTQLNAQIMDLIDTLEKAWARRGRTRSLIDELLKLKRAGGDFSLDACNECSKTGGGS